MASALLVVDVQNGVVDGIDSAPEVIATIASLIAAARAMGRPVVWVQHDDDDLPGGSAAWQIVPELEPAADEVVIGKQH